VPERQARRAPPFSPAIRANPRRRNLPRVPKATGIAEPYLTLTTAEAAFPSVAYDTLIPADTLSPSGTDCGLVAYIDRQLAGAWGSGAHLYRAGPFIEGKPEQGYQPR
jgi:gluconate 2-dehydrogenase gamma chain